MSPRIQIKSNNWIISPKSNQIKIFETNFEFNSNQIKPVKKFKIQIKSNQILSTFFHFKSNQIKSCKNFLNSNQIKSNYWILFGNSNQTKSNHWVTFLNSNQIKSNHWTILLKSNQIKSNHGLKLWIQINSNQIIGQFF